MRTTLLILCGLSAGCSASFTGLAIERADGTDPTVTVTTDLTGERTSVEANRENLACLGLTCDATRVPGEALCNDAAANPFAGTAIAEFFACYGASGACSLRNGSSDQLDFANGARFETVDDGIGLTGPGAGDACIAGGQKYSSTSRTSTLLFFQL